MVGNGSLWLLGYSDRDREDAGMQVLAAVVQDKFGTQLEDCRSIVGHGADGKDDAGRF